MVGTFAALKFKNMKLTTTTG